LEKAKEKELLLEEQYANRQDELKSKTEKLKELYNRYKEKQSDLKDLQDEWEVERVDLVDDIRKLDQKLRLRDLILRHYVPDRWLKKIEDRAHYNEPTDEWVIPGLHYAANNIDHEERKEMRRKANSTYARNLMMRGRRQFDAPSILCEKARNHKWKSYKARPQSKIRIILTVLTFGRNATSGRQRRRNAGTESCLLVKTEHHLVLCVERADMLPCPKMVHTHTHNIRTDNDTRAMGAAVQQAVRCVDCVHAHFIA